MNEKLAYGVTWCRTLLSVGAPLSWLWRRCRRGDAHTDGCASVELSAARGVAPGEHAAGVVVSGCRLSGKGSCYASVPLVQDRVYFEVHVGEVFGAASSLAVGCGARPAAAGDLEKKLGEPPGSFGAAFGGPTGHSELKPGDIIGCAFDQDSGPVHLKFWRNGAAVPGATLKGMRGEQWPALFIDNCSVEWVFGENSLKYLSAIPGRFSALMASKALIESP